MTNQEKDQEISPELSEKIEKIRLQFADEWDDWVTTPDTIFSEEEMQYGTLLRSGQKLPGSHKWVQAKIVRICQDFRLSVEEIDRVKAALLEQSRPPRED